MSSVTGLSFSMLLSIDNIVHAIGNNEYGQLGLGENAKNISVPTPIRTLPKIKHISCGFYFTACIDMDGFLYTFGDNTSGQLGVGQVEKYNTPQKVTDIPKIKAVSCGGHHTLIISNNSDLWAVGKNDYGQLCLKNKEMQTTFQQTTFSNVVEISAGYSHSFFQSSITIYASGYNVHGQLGLGHNYTSDPCTILNQPPNIVQFCGGFQHSLFLDGNGNVYSVGLNKHGRLGLGNEINQNILQKIPNIPEIQSITCAGDSSYLVDVKGNLWSFGRNEEGQLGLNDLQNRNTPTLVGLKDITSVSGSFGYHFFARNKENKAFILGSNNNGQLGIENVNSISIPQELDTTYSEDIWGSSIENLKIYQDFEEMENICISQNNGDSTFVELEDLENKLDEHPDIEKISEVEQKCYDNVTMFRLITAVNKTKQLQEKSSKKEEKTSFIKKELKQKTEQLYSQAREKIYPKHDKTTLGYINVKELQNNLVAQFDIIFENQKNGDLDLDKEEIDILLKEKKEKIETIENFYSRKIKKIKSKIAKETKNKGHWNFKQIKKWCNEAERLFNEQKNKLEKICDPANWMLNWYKTKKINFFKNCIQCYGEEQLITYKALAIGTVKRRSDNIEKIAKFSHQITKGGIAISELVAVGFVPGFGAIGFVSAFMSLGRNLMKYYKNIEMLKKAKKILNHTGRKLKDIYKFVNNLSAKFIDMYKDQIHAFSFNSIEFIAQLLIEQSIPVLLKEKKISKQKSISKCSSVLFPLKSPILYKIFDTVISPYCIEIDDGPLISARIFLRDGAFRSRKDDNFPFEYLIPADEKKQKLSKTLEHLHIDPFRTIPYDDFLALQNNSNDSNDPNNSNNSNKQKINKIKYSKLSEKEVEEWKKGITEKDICLEMKKKDYPTYGQKVLDYVNATPEIRNKNKRRQGQAPPGGDGGFIGDVVDCVDEIYVNYLHFKQILACYDNITAEKGDTKDDVVSVVSLLGNFSEYAIIRDGVTFVADNI